MKKCNPLLPRWPGNGSCPTRRERSSCRHSQKLLSALAFYGWKGKVLATQSCSTLSDHTDCSPPGSSVHGILQARILEWVAIPFSRGSSWPRDWTWVSCIIGRVFTVWVTREAPVYSWWWCWCLVASVVSDSVWPHALWPTGLLCPWDSPSKNTGVGWRALLQGIFQTQGLNPGLSHFRQIFLLSEPLGS